jgi:hypothetical protein
MRIIKDKIVWNTVLDEFNESDIYFKYEYFDLYKKHYDMDFEAIFWENDYIKIFWPHLIRDISKLDKFKDFNFYDLITPYGYGGPLVNLKVNNQIKALESTKSFFEEYKEHVIRNNFVCEFIRFHPILKNWEMFDNVFKIEYLNDVIIIDLSRNLKEIWMDIRNSHRRCINRSIKEGCEVKFITKPSKEDINNFIKIYYQTMDKTKAAQKYYFSKEFIEDHFKLLDTVLVQLEYKNKIIGSSINPYGKNYIYGFLTGTSAEKNVYPSHLMLFELMKWAKDRNFKYLNIGGGLRKNDNLFLYKKGFSKKEFPFYIAKLIFNEDIYNELTNINNKVDSKNYFPNYRFGLDENIL